MNYLGNKKDLNNYEQLNILNQNHNYLNNINKLNIKKKQSKIILLEKSFPNHFPIYVKVIKKNRNESRNSYIGINTYTNRDSNLNSYKINRNSLNTEINQNKNNNLFNLNISNNIDGINKLKRLLKGEIKENEEIINKDIRKIRFISISPSHNSKTENSDKKNSKENNIDKEIKVEENCYNNNEINLFNDKHKMRYLLSKNYCGKRLIKRKNKSKSLFSNASDNININNISNKKDLENQIEDNNNIINNYDKTDSSKKKEIYNNDNPTRNNKYYKNEELKNRKILIKNKTTSNNQQNKDNIIQEEIYINAENNADNIFLKIRNSKKIRIKLNDLVLLEQKLENLIISLNNKDYLFENNSINESVEFISFYFNSSLRNTFPLFFNIKNQIIIKSAFNLSLFMCLIIYHLLINPSLITKVILLIRRIFGIIKINLFLIVREIELYFGEEFIQQNEIYFKVFDYYLQENNLYDLKEKEIIDIIIKNCISISTDIENILDYYQIINNKYYSDFQDIYMTISKIDEKYIYFYFYNNLYNNNFEFNISKHNKYINTENTNENYEIVEQNEDDKYLDIIINSYIKNKKIPPFITFKTNKKYSLVLDLEDTLINVKIDNEGKIFCRARPGLISFLNGIKPFYEIISFTKLSKEYSDIIIKEIEGDKKLFDYNLYREHCSLIGRNFIKDISRIGRDMKKVIMVDDSQENLNIHINNSILICPYNAEDDEEDRVLFELKKLLILFFRQGYDDIRISIKNFRNEIYNKITIGNKF